MAQKDWKKDKRYSNGWTNKKGDSLYISELGTSLQRRGQVFYSVQISKANEKFFRTLKDTKTKSKALAYAKSYMRKH